MYHVESLSSHSVAHFYAWHNIKSVSSDLNLLKSYDSLSSHDIILHYDDTRSSLLAKSSSKKRKFPKPEIMMDVSYFFLFLLF